MFYDLEFAIAENKKDELGTKKGRGQMLGGSRWMLKSTWQKKGVHPV